MKPMDMMTTVWDSIMTNHDGRHVPVNSICISTFRSSSTGMRLATRQTVAVGGEAGMLDDLDATMIRTTSPCCKPCVDGLKRSGME